MQPAASHPLTSDRARTARASRTGPPLALPDAHDGRYPRAWWFRVPRALAGVWWLPLAVYVGYGATALVLADPAAGTEGGLPALTRAYALDGLVSLVGGQAWLLALLAPALLALAAVGVVIQRRAADDAGREAMALLLREVSASEQANSAWMRHALLPALEWRVQSVRRRRHLLGAALLLAALLLGALLAVLFGGPVGMLTASLGA